MSHNLGVNKHERPNEPHLSWNKDKLSATTSQSNKLPIDGYKKTILYLLEKNDIVLVIAETGSGKSTRLPQILYSAGIYNNYDDRNVRSISRLSGISGGVLGKGGQTSESCKKENKKIICVTQPRRIAAMQLAQRVADDMKCELGTTVGFSVRFVEQIDEEETKIKFITEGLLLREMMYDPLLTKYSVIIVDEVHEWNLNTDILLALLKCLLLKRNDLKLIICSATLNVEQILHFFDNKNQKIICDNDNNKQLLRREEQEEEAGRVMRQLSSTVLCIPTKIYPTKIYYKNEPTANYLESAIETVININESNLLKTGKILVFLTGQDEVDYVCQQLNEYADTNSSRLDIQALLALPLHASLKSDEVSRVFQEYGRNTRLCIVATNIAETSLTISDVAFVIDCGFVKIKVHDNASATDSLIRVPISKSSANQRAGRAGRTREGKVYRLYTESEFNKLQDEIVPEIQRSHLSEVIMLMLSLGIKNVQRFPLISPMPRDNLVNAIELLYALQIIDNAGQLTSLGEKAALLNLDPKLAKILVSPETAFCTQEACRIIAMLQVKEIYTKQGKYVSDLWSNNSLLNICVSEGDLPSYLNIINGFISNNRSQKWAEKRNLNYQALLNATEISNKLEAQLKTKCNISIKSSDGRIDLIRQSLVKGFFPNAAYLHPNGDYKTIRSEQTVYVHPTSIFSGMIEKPKYVVFAEISNTTKPFMRHIMAIESDWLLNSAPHFYNFATGL